MSSDEPYDFDEQLNYGLKWEKRVKPYIKQNLTAMTLENIEFDEDPERQLAGVDYESRSVDADIDIKTYSHKNIIRDYFVIETISVLPHGSSEPQSKGWFYTSDSDFVVVVGENRAGTDVYHRGWIMPLQTGVREWFDETPKDDWDFSFIDNGNYDTGIYWVPTSDIPDEFLFSFDPRPPNSKREDTNQPTLEDFIKD